MKILHPGTLPQNIFFTGTCTNCSAQVEANYSEVTRRNLGDRYSGEFIESFVLCPTQGCGRRIIMIEKPSKTLEQCFDQLFPPLPRKESVKLKLPPRFPTKIPQIAKSCKCGNQPTSIREKTLSELFNERDRLREIRLKLPPSAFAPYPKPSGIREKTLSELFNELFNE